MPWEGASSTAPAFACELVAKRCVSGAADHPAPVLWAILPCLAHSSGGQCLVTQRMGRSFEEAEVLGTLIDSDGAAVGRVPCKLGEIATIAHASAALCQSCRALHSSALWVLNVPDNGSGERACTCLWLHAAVR